MFRTLTSREREIVQMLAKGKSNKEVANELSISAKTVETHCAAVIRKLDEINSIVEFVHYAIRNKLVEAQPLRFTTPAPDLKYTVHPISGVSHITYCGSADLRLVSPQVAICLLL